MDNVFAGFLQNLLGNIITINRIFNQVVEFSEKNETVKMYALIGRIFKLVVEFEPALLEEAANPLYENNRRPIVMQSDNANENAFKNTTDNSTDDSQNSDDSQDLDSFNLKDIDFTFGLFDNYPGLKQLFSLAGPA